MTPPSASLEQSPSGSPTNIQPQDSPEQKENIEATQDILGDADETVTDENEIYPPMQKVGERIDLIGNGGVVKIIEESGDPKSAFPCVGDECVVHYAGTFEDGKEFDSSYKRDKPFTFRVGLGEVIQGWDICVMSMRQGESCKVEIQHKYAYGDSGSPPVVPPKANLIFKIKLISFMKKTKHVDDPAQLNESDAVRQAQELKEEGTKQFNLNQLKEAAQAFERAANTLKYYEGYSDELLPKARLIKLQAHLNLAMTLLKMEDWLEASLAATAALAIDNQNVKALYRRGRARCMIGELEGARADLVAAAKMDPQNAQIRQQLDSCKKLQARYDKDLSATYKNMFRK